MVPDHLCRAGCTAGAPFEQAMLGEEPKECSSLLGRSPVSLESHKRARQLTNAYSCNKREAAHIGEAVGRASQLHNLLSHRLIVQHGSLAGPRHT